MFVEPYLANITIFAGNFAPRGWALCNGQLLAIAANDALFALIGTTYGGDGVTTFALPDLRSRVAVHAGQGVGLSNYVLGQMAGTENTTLLTANLPQHTHAFTSLTGAPGATDTVGNQGTPVNNVAAQVSGIDTYNSAGTSTMATTTKNVSTAITGSNVPMNNVSPVLAMNYIIAVEGIFPSRN